jgi:hypothetical protein
MGELAVRYRQRECLTFLLANERTNVRTTLDAAFRDGRRTSDYSFYMWLVRFLLRTNRWDEDMHSAHVLSVAKEGFGLLKHLHAQGLPLCSQLIPFAIEQKDDANLFWLLTKGCPWNVDTTNLLKRHRGRFLESVCLGHLGHLT